MRHMLHADMETFKHYTKVAEWCHEQPGQPTPWVTMLYGSQNYGLESAESDVDTKSMLLPSFEMVCLNSKRISTEVVMPDGSLDNCKDFREMFGNYLKGNINFVETLYTRHFDCTELYYPEFKELQEQRDLIANCQPQKLMHMACGMARQKYAAFSKEFEGKKEVLAKYGYDPKQLHHLVRLFYFMKTFRDTMDFEQALLCCHPQVDADTYRFVMSFKAAPYPLAQAEKMKEEYMKRIEALCDNASLMPEDQGYEEAKAYLDGLTVRLLRKHLRKELL